ncbi:MAG TPA: 3-deoxy-7-phosphoheptulonate synthase [Longimicrobiales bacterium]|nr:3-deoxy-7-phosphoheptulonate synthase [Longimicrobiales bacterium]
MIITLKNDADPAPVQRELVRRGLWVRRLEGGDNIQFLIEPRSANVPRQTLLAIDGVATVAVETPLHPRIDQQTEVVNVAGVPVGVAAPAAFMAGPCSVESEAQIHAIAARLAPLGVQFLRGGAFKARSSPYDFQGHGEAALGWLRSAADAHGLRVVTEVLSPDDAGRVAARADLLQIGSRNMQNFALLRAAAVQNRPMLLKRGMAATVDEWLLAGEYCLVHGAPSVVFCERGIRGFDPSTRNLLDLGAVALLANVHRLPVIVDPSHGAGRRDLLPALSRAALAAGACGVMLETHDDPGSALSDGPQALPPEQLESLLRGLRPTAER